MQLTELTDIFLIPCCKFAPKSIHQIALFQFQKYKISKLLRGHIPQTPLCTSKSFLNVKVTSIYLPVGLYAIGLSEQNGTKFITISYINMVNWFCSKTCFENERKLCEERCFGVLKTLKTQELWGICFPDPRRGDAPGPHQRHQGPLSGQLDPTCRVRSTPLFGQKRFWFSPPPRSNKSCTPHARNGGMNSLKVYRPYA